MSPLKVGVVRVQSSPVRHARPEPVGQPLLGHHLQLVVAVGVPHGAGELLVRHLGVVLDLAPQPGVALRVADDEDAVPLAVPGDDAGVVAGVPQQAHYPLRDLLTCSCNIQRQLD